MPRVAFGISFGSATPLRRREGIQKFLDLVRMADDFGAAALGTFDTRSSAAPPTCGRP